jgi:hypothetical protein
MGNSNETMRSSRSAGASLFRRHSTRRRSASTTGGGGPIPEEEIDRNGAISTEFVTPKPQKRMDKIRRSLSFRKKKKSSAGGPSSRGANKELGSGSSSGRKAITDTPTVTNTSQPSEQNSTDSAAAHTTNNQNSTTSTTQGAATSTTTTTTPATSTNAQSGAPNRPALWIEDERRVRAGNCSFQVKYLGYQEVADSRGMHICELALEKLLSVSELFLF